MTQVLVIDGNPARLRETFSAALCQAYVKAAQEAGHDVRSLNIAALDFDPILHDGNRGNQPPEPDLQVAKDAIKWARHIVIVYPLWQLGMPALLKGFLERVFTPGFAYAMSGRNPLNLGLLKGRSVRLVQTMAMPEMLYRLTYRSHGSKALASFLGFCGLAPVNVSLMGGVESSSDARIGHLNRIRILGAKAL